MPPRAFKSASANSSLSGLLPAMSSIFGTAPGRYNTAEAVRPEQLEKRLSSMAKGHTLRLQCN